MQYELTSETLRFLLGIRHNGSRREIIATLRPYDNGRLIALLKETESAYLPSKTDSDALDLKVNSEAVRAYRELFEAQKVMVTVDGKEAPDSVIEKIDALYRIRILFFRHGYFGITDVEPNPEEQKEIDFERDFGDEVSIQQKFNLVDEQGKEQAIEICQVLRFPTAEDRIAWDRCRTAQTIKGGGQRIRYNYEKVGHLYDSMVKEARGFAINGAACVESNKPDWIKRIPYIFKFRAMDSTFDRLTEKNG